jgi:hypothetical protein
MRTPLSQNVTQRLLQQATNGKGQDAVARYLRAFGVSDLSLSRIPAVFKEEFTPEWKAFLKANTQLHGDPQRQALQATLSFIRYCQALKINPFVENFNYRDPVTSGSKVDIKKIRLSLEQNELTSIFKMLKSEINKLRISGSLIVSKTKLTVGKIGKQDVLIATYVLSPSSKRQPLDMILKDLEGGLYNGTVPAQLQPMLSNDKKIDRRLPANTLLTGNGTAGWYAISRNTEYSVWMIRAKAGQLVMKVLVNLSPVSKDNGDIPFNDRLKMWGKFKPFG